MSLSYAPVENKRKHQRQGTRYGTVTKEVSYRRDSVTIAIGADRWVLMCKRLGSGVCYGFALITQNKIEKSSLRLFFVSFKNIFSLI